jgi:hypothetical protein
MLSKDPQSGVWRDVTTPGWASGKEPLVFGRTYDPSKRTLRCAAPHRTNKWAAGIGVGMLGLYSASPWWPLFFNVIGWVLIVFAVVILIRREQPLP